MLVKDSFPDIGKTGKALILKIRYISVSFQQINTLHYIYLPLLCPLPSGKVYQGMNRTHTRRTWSCRTHLQKLSFTSSITHIDTVISPDTDTSDHLPELPNPSSYPAPAPSEKNQALPPAPALRRGLVRNRTRICSGCREFLLSLPRLRLPSKASRFACDFAI